MKLRHSRTGRDMAVHNPVMFLARDREIAEEAFAGDVIGIQNHGQLRIGDSLAEGAAVHFTGVPSFAPEMLMRVRLDDPMRAKHLGRALLQLAEEGVSQVFRPLAGGAYIVGAVGPLQFDVLMERIEAEYNIRAHFEPVPVWAVRWVDGDDPRALKRFADANESSLAEDHDGALVLLARNAWHLDRTAEDWPALRFLKTREVHERLAERAV